jgi:PAS domain S-box-containing protein
MTQQSDPKLAALRTEHRSALSELERYKLLVENVQDYAIFFMDKNGTIMTWNKGAQRAKGYAPDEIIGQNFSVFYTEKDRAAHKPQRMLALASRHGRFEDEDWRVRKDGSKFWADVVITALHKDNEVVGYAKVTRDLTERKKQEDKLRDANILLRQQRVELTELNASKDEFVSLASHQLRTPATAVKQLLGIIVEGLQGPVPEHLLPILTKAYESNERQIQIVNNLLKVAQLDAGKIQLHLESAQLEDMLANIIDEQQDTLGSRRQTVDLDVPQHAPAVFVDQINLRMALSNIIDNASKYSHPGSRITVSLKQDGHDAVLRFRDQGVGISPADQAKLFSKFTRIPNELSDQVNGSGLGLYWTKKIIELHGGTIAIESAVNQGATMTVRLPIGGQ